MKTEWNYNHTRSRSVLISNPFSSFLRRNSLLPTSLICLEKQLKFWEFKFPKSTQTTELFYKVFFLNAQLKWLSILKNHTIGIIEEWFSARHGVGWRWAESVRSWLNPWWGHSSLIDNSRVCIVMCSVLFFSLGLFLFEMGDNNWFKVLIYNCINVLHEDLVKS